MQPTQLPLGIRLRDSSVFRSFYAGRNHPLIEALQSLREGEPPRCVWLSGGEGAGKSHLLQAVCAHAGQRNLTAAYFPLGTAQITPDMLAGCGQIAHVCVDDLQLVAGQRDWERALFSLYQEIDEHRGRLWVASTSAPAAVPIKLPDLASRFGGGLVLTLEALSDEERVEALKLRARWRGRELPDETARYLLRRLPRDMSTLCAFLDQLDAESIAAQRRLTVRFVSEMLRKTAAT